MKWKILLGSVEKGKRSFSGGKMFISNRNFEEEILDALNKKGRYIQELSELLKVSRGTLNKYLAILEAKGKIKSEFIGVSKVYRRC